LAVAAVQPKRKPRRRRLAVAPAERERIAERKEPLEAKRDRSERREGRLERLPQRARERLEKRGFDRRARPFGLASRLVRTIGADRFAEDRGHDQAIDALIERDHQPRLGFGAVIDGGGEAREAADRLKERRWANFLDRSGGEARDQRLEALRRLGHEAVESVSKSGHPFDGETGMFEHRALKPSRAMVE